MSSRRLLLALATLVAVVAVVVGWRAAADPHPQGPSASPPTPAGAPPPPSLSTPPDRGGAVRWDPGPWGPATLAGSPVLLPASSTDGPLVRHATGWAEGYPPTAVAAAITVLRAGLMALGAPPALHTQVDAGTLADPTRVGQLIGPTRNEEPAWTLPAPLLSGGQAARVRLLGVVVDLDGSRATAQVYQAVTGAGGDTLTRSTYQLIHRDQQWLIDEVGATTVVPAGPATYTLPVPSEG